MSSVFDNFEDHYESYKKWKASAKTPFNEKKKIKINIWSGAELEKSPVSGQRASFDLALGILCTRLKKELDCPPIEFEHRGNKAIRDHKLSPMDMVNWLLTSDIHIILTHPHQGPNPDKRYNLWNIPDLAYSLDLLQYHIGFPNGMRIRCPVFRQDKYRYLVALKDLALPTMQIILTEDGKYDALIPLLIQ